MTEKLIKSYADAIDCLKKNKPTSGYYMLQESVDMAIKALEEVQHWHTSVINPKIKNVFANSSTQICQNCDHKDEYIEELEAEVKEYREIGTPEECRAAVEKQKPKKPVMDGYCCFESYECPTCHHDISNEQKYCDKCGQKLGDDEE